MGGDRVVGVSRDRRGPSPACCSFVPGVLILVVVIARSGHDTGPLPPSGRQRPRRGWRRARGPASSPASGRPRSVFIDPTTGVRDARRRSTRRPASGVTSPRAEAGSRSRTEARCSRIDATMPASNCCTGGTIGPVSPFATALSSPWRRSGSIAPAGCRSGAAAARPAHGGNASVRVRAVRSPRGVGRRRRSSALVARRTCRAALARPARARTRASHGATAAQTSG